jgi:hypothetical protein
MVQANHGFNLRHSIIFGRLGSWLKLLRREKVSRAYVGRTILLLSTSLLTLPFRMYESLRYRHRVKSVVISEPPIFIIGHPRSGTTHLHNLMCQDKNMGYVTTLQAVAPDFLFVAGKTLKPLLKKLMPSGRAMDQVSVTMDGPQEEEIAVFNLSPHAFLYHLWFPQNAYYYFERYALFRHVPESVIAEWKDTYMEVMRKATLYMDHKRLVLKSPMNTGHVNLLLDLFPDAKFIHIVRNPYTVFVSTKRMYRRILGVAQLQEISWEEIVDYILLFYKEMMQKFLKDSALVPPGNLVTVKFEDLETDPLSELQRIYAHLNLPRFSETEPTLRAYIASQADYQKGKYDLSNEDIDQVNQHWAFALKEWGYNLIAA